MGTSTVVLVLVVYRTQCTTGTRQCYYYVSCLAAAAAAGTRTVYIYHSLPIYLAVTSRVGALFNCSVPQSGLFCGGRVVLQHQEAAVTVPQVIMLRALCNRCGWCCWRVQHHAASCNNKLLVLMLRGFVACQHVDTHTWGLARSVLLCYVPCVTNNVIPFVHTFKLRVVCPRLLHV